MTEAEKFLNSLINYERTKSLYYDFKLDKFRKFLDAIGNPEKKLSNVILIAGTKGKGSTATFIESGLRSCELKTGLYTSPHILSVRERIKVNNHNISQADFDRLLEKIKIPAKKFKITFFEAMTAVAFLYFLEKKIDYTILEVGLGGRLDATNVVNPKVSVITRIGYDHTNILGKTLEKIAREKAGIIHSDNYVVISQQRPSALRAIKEQVRKTHSDLCESAKQFSVKNIQTSLRGTQFVINNFGKLRIKLIGKHQVENVCTALSVLTYLEQFDAKITDKKIKSGLASAEISARCQLISKKPVIMVDGAHNPESIQALSQIIKDVIKRKVVIVFGSSQGKLTKKMFKILAPITKQFILTQSQNPRSIPVFELAKDLKPYKIPYITTDSVAQALHQKINKTTLIITGSFYVASEAIDFFAKSKLYKITS